MCSVSDDIEELQITCKDSEYMLDTKKNGRCIDVCRKCKEPSTVLLHNKDPYCTSCFLIYCRHKFKSTIGKAKLIKPEHKVLLACSCGAKSTAMLDMILQALTENSHKKFLFQIGVLFIDESSIVSSHSKEINEILLNRFKTLQKYNYPLLYSSLEVVFRHKFEEPFYWCFENKPELSNSNDSIARLLESLNTFQSLTSKLDYIYCLKQQLILNIAKSENYSHIFVGDSATDLAIKFLSHVAVGRGSQVSNNTAFYDAESDVPICRPMREFLNKEIVFYNKFMNVQFSIQPTLITKSESQSCIQRLTESFVNGLQENFPATVFTIFRTGGKISANNCSTDTKCLLCKSVKDNSNPHECSAIKALSISNELSDSSSHDVDNLEYNKLMELLCHGCQILLNDMENYSHLPSLLFEDKQWSRKDMKEEIKDCLLDDE